MVEHSSDVVSLIDADGTIAYLSDSSLRVFGHDGQALLGSRFGELLDEPSRVRLATTIAEVAQQPLGAAVVELRLLHGDGGWRQIETTVTNLLDEPAVSALVLNSRDVSERRRLENQLTHQAFHDPLTGLANRALFSDRVQHAVQRRAGQRRHGRRPVPRPRRVQGGQRQPRARVRRRAAASRSPSGSSDCVGPADTIARLGGDEFAVLIEGADVGGGRRSPTADRIRAALAAAINVGGARPVRRGQHRHRERRPRHRRRRPADPQRRPRDVPGEGPPATASR